MFRTASVGMNRSRAVMVLPRTADDHGVIKLKLRAVRSQSVAGLHYIYLTAAERQPANAILSHHWQVITIELIHVKICTSLLTR